ncbi:GNAT family N-acetyltransferase [Flavobacteriales bacterium]|nr:GNAT family N-acetyltransferase [Flavobacteriales bacterium]
MNVKNHQISLRLLEDNDLEFLYSIENNPVNKKYGSDTTYLSKKILKAYIKNSGADLSIYGQKRFVITLNNISIGLIDLFDYNQFNRSAYVGIIIINEFQNNNYGSIALELLISYSWDKLDLLSLYANINPKNNSSVSLFNKFYFKKIKDTLYKLDK